jgi:hypothetical protein
VTNSPTGPDVERIAQEVERYIAANPDAADTVEGIARWWLMLADVEAALMRVEAALDLLVRRGVMSRQLLPDGNCVYSTVREPGR